MKPLPPNLLLKSVINIPIYDAQVYLFVSLDAEATYRQAHKAHGFVSDAGGHFEAISASDDAGSFAMFFHKDLLTSKLIGHEVLHITNLINDYIGIVQCKKCKDDELHARLVGYLHEWVARMFRSANLTVT